MLTLMWSQILWLNKNISRLKIRLLLLPQSNKDPLFYWNTVYFYHNCYCNETRLSYLYSNKFFKVTFPARNFRIIASFPPKNVLSDLSSYQVLGIVFYLEILMRRSNCSAPIPPPPSRHPRWHHFFYLLPGLFIILFLPCPALFDHFDSFIFRCLSLSSLRFQVPHPFLSHTFFLWPRDWIGARHGGTTINRRIRSSKMFCRCAVCANHCIKTLTFLLCQPKDCRAKISIYLISEDNFAGRKFRPFYYLNYHNFGRK